MRAPLRTMRSVARPRSSSAATACKCLAVIWMACSGLRRSWLSMPSSRLRARVTCTVNDAMDSASAWSIASLNRMRSSMPGGSGRHASIQPFSTLARSARYSEASWSMLKPLSARRIACVWAAVLEAPLTAGARPIDFAVCSSGLWAVARSATIACRISGPWSRSEREDMCSAAGKRVVANASHRCRMASMSRRMKSPRRMRPP